MASGGGTETQEISVEADATETKEAPAAPEPKA
jgi:hypothetical protein